MIRSRDSSRDRMRFLFHGSPFRSLPFMTFPICDQGLSCYGFQYPSSHLSAVFPDVCRMMMYFLPGGLDRALMYTPDSFWYIAASRQSSSPSHSLKRP